MLIERIWSANPYRNFHYLIACPQSGEALAVDPLEWGLCLNAARQKGWDITQILNTHLARTESLADLVRLAQTDPRWLNLEPLSPAASRRHAMKASGPSGPLSPGSARQQGI